MATKIGLLLPRSTDYPAMGFDMLDGIRAGLSKLGITDAQIVTDNIGFGEDTAGTYAKAERLLLQEDVQLLVVYSNVSNAACLYPLAASAQRPFLFLDAGMQLPAGAINEYCYHISLQGIHCCHFSGKQVAQGGKKVLIATSFYDGGYRGPWSYHTSIASSGGAVCGNYVSGYKVAGFTIAPYLEMLETAGADGVAACFSSYLAELFMQSLATAGEKAVTLPFYCSSYMAEEQLLAKCDFPGGVFHAIVPWASSIDNAAQTVFKAAVLQQRNKQANIFHLMGWEAAILAKQALQEGAAALTGWTYNSPRGQVHIHTATHHTYAPLYTANIIQDLNGKCALQLTGHIVLNDQDHTYYQLHQAEETASGWRNNYLCI
jgi:branched-chain amino acid transport system substrate-binding protein